MDQHEQPAETAGLSAERLDTLIQALSAQPRRMIYAYFTEHDSASLEELTDVVVGWSRAHGGDTDASDWDDTNVALHHRHLPVLDDAGVITYDADQRTATRASLSPSTTEVLATITDLDTAGTDHED